MSVVARPGGSRDRDAEVETNTAPLIRLDRASIENLVTKARGNRRHRARLCLHTNLEDAVHEMIVVHAKGNYVRPHRHAEKSESFHVIEGRLRIVLFSDGGLVTEQFTVGPYSAGETMLFRIAAGIWHSMLPLSDWVVFHEVTKGPFLGQNDSSFPEWAPEEEDEEGVRRFLVRLAQE